MGEHIVEPIVQAVADAQGIDPAAVTPPVQEFIDTDAIQQLAAHPTASWTLSFALSNHNVVINSDGLVLVDGVQQETWA